VTSEALSCVGLMMTRASVRVSECGAGKQKWGGFVHSWWLFNASQVTAKTAQVKEVSIFVSLWKAYMISQLFRKIIMGLVL